MTQRPPSSEAVALRLAAAGLPAAVWAGARFIYHRALRLIRGQRASYVRQELERVRSELLVVRAAEQIVADYAARTDPTTE
ncbi:MULTISPECIES: hypothetical protein [unclassified Streptomyces]|uniref:hypothetical protein n=1 Tax=unclassified Streptomyces TaxID=2593676 RepID=UPI000887AD7E|nr:MULTISPECIES: hypothetical protein [unclassified Streptomyces]PBC72347.1 hypothetical protein BX261_7431 [Streptomyces sp. 2321.6]SDR62093.1 hypothetical protein SAMN05216511_7272 [Streptomyces sp. KS_16]SEE50179.1 hypothetical protein SAMN05428940_7321 [Streptomyces sp. 2133.1]SNC77851.1 hypothetical protein SAMN06272741_7267 [Streptomyces sp. 2114.4]